MEPVSVAATLLTIFGVLGAAVLARYLGYGPPYRVFAPLALLAGTVVAVVTGGLDTDPGLRLGIVLGFATATGAVHYLDSPGGAWTAVLRRRFLMGVPWGTLVSICFVASVYLFLQGGLEHPYSPLSIPFTSWSYFYPVGMLTAPFSHAGFGHVTGNLIGTIVLAPIAEYAWNHYPTRRGTSTFASWRHNPYVRAFVLFPLGVIVVGLGTSIFSWGAIIGFSGVVFAFSGFAVVRYPLLTVIALSARGAINAIYYALRNPIVVESASPSYGPPWWVGIAVQGHLLGLLLGALLGIAIFGRRRTAPSAGRVFTGVVLLGFSFALYAVWWYRNPTTFVLYRGLGILLIIALAVILTVALRSSSRPLLEGVSRRQVAFAIAIIPLLTMALVAIPLNSTTIQQPDPPAHAIEVGDYQIYYAEDVSNARVNAIDFAMFNETTNVTASGVIVTSERRHVWTEAESAGSLAFWGQQPIRVGGIGWRQTVWAERVGWRVNGGGPVYHVYLKVEGGEYKHVYTSSNDTASPTIDHRNVTIVPESGNFNLYVTNNTTSLGYAQMPEPENRTRAGGITFVRVGERVYAIREGTRVLIATKESYS